MKGNNNNINNLRIYKPFDIQISYGGEATFIFFVNVHIYVVPIPKVP